MMKNSDAHHYRPLCKPQKIRQNGSLGSWLTFEYLCDFKTDSRFTTTGDLPPAYPASLLKWDADSDAEKVRAI